jgi:hypothetical protein
MRRSILPKCLLTICPVALIATPSYAQSEWLQFGRNGQHSGYQPSVIGQPLDAIRLVMTNDTQPHSFIDIHYAVPMPDAAGNIYISFRDPGPPLSVKQIDESGAVHWTYASDWVPPPSGWEPVFHPVIANGYVYAPGAYGAIHVLSPTDGSLLFDIASYDIPPDPNIRNQLRTTVFVSGVPTIADDGTLYYSVYALANNPLGLVSHLVQVTVDGTISSVSYAALTGDSQQRPPLNAAAAVAPDGTVYIGSTRGNAPGWLVAVNPDLSLKWMASTASDPNHQANLIDLSTSSPMVAPDGRIYYGGHNGNGLSQGYMYEFSPDGQFLAYFDFGWDTTPAIFPDPDGDPTHYYLVQKYNRYGDGRYWVTALDPNTNPMTIVWQWELVGNEFCINAPAVDQTGAVYVLGEDGYLYRIAWGAQNVTRVFLDRAISAAYTPVSLGPDGTVYALNNGKVFVVGSARE